MKSYSHWLHWNVTSNFHCSLHKTPCLSDKTEIILATKASASMAGSHRLAFLFLGFKFQLLLLVWLYLFVWLVLLVFFFWSSNRSYYKIWDSVSKLLDYSDWSPPSEGQHTCLCEDGCPAFDNPHLLYSGGEKENRKGITLFNLRPKVSQTEVRLISPVQLFLEYGFIF